MTRRARNRYGLASSVVAVLAIVACSQSALESGAPTPAEEAGASDAGSDAAVDTGDEASPPMPVVHAGDLMGRALRKGGSRLSVQELATDDGVAEPAGFFDTVRNETCRFRRDETGVFRCLPDHVAYVSGGKPVHLQVALPECGAPSYALEKIDLSKAQPRNLCTFPGFAVWTLNAAGDALDAKVSPSDFVEAVVDELPGDRLTPTILRAADGAIDVMGWYDALLATVCELDLVQPSTAECLPLLANAEPATNGACGGPMQFRLGYTVDCRELDYAGVLDGGRYRLSDQVVSANRAGYTKLPCPITGRPMGEEVTAKIVRFGVPDLGPTRLVATVPDERESFWWRPEGTPAINVAWLDHDTSQACGFRVASDGKIRCAPVTVYNLDFSLFEDAACSEPVVSPSAPSIGKPATTFATNTRGACEPTDIMRMGDVIASTATLYQWWGTPPTRTCMAVRKWAGEVHHVVRLAPTDFVEGRFITR